MNPNTLAAAERLVSALAAVDAVGGLSDTLSSIEQRNFLRAWNTYGAFMLSDPTAPRPTSGNVYLGAQQVVAQLGGSK